MPSPVCADRSTLPFLHRLVLLVPLAAGCWSCALADEPEQPALSVSGFGTAGVAHSSESRADFTANPAKGIGAGYTHRWSADVDSVMGLQLTANFTPQLSAVVQIISEQNYDRTYRPHTEWANVKYQINPDFSLRLGRTALPLVLEADSRKIGYANPWVRPPSEVYNLVTFTSNDGADVSYRLRIGDTTQTIQATTGRSTSRFPVTSPTTSHTTLEIRSLHSLVDTLEHGPVTVRLSYAHARLTIPELELPFDGFDQLGPQGQAIVQKYHVRDKPATAIGVSASYDPGDWFVTGEFGRVNLHSFLGVNTGWYVTSGYRIGRFTPYATVARIHADGNTGDPGVPLAGLSPSVAPVAAALNGFLNAALAGKTAQTTYSIGGRWDFAKAASLKLQFDHTLLDANSPGTLTNLQPGFVPGGRVNVLSATVDFVF